MNISHLSVPTSVTLVLGLYNLQTNSSKPAKMSCDGMSVVPSLQKASKIDVFALQNIFQHVGFPLPANRPVVSHPVKQWNPGRAAATFSPRESYMGSSGTHLYLSPVPRNVYRYYRSFKRTLVLVETGTRRPKHKTTPTTNQPKLDVSLNVSVTATDPTSC